MTNLELTNILTGSAADIVKSFKVSSYTLPAWSELNKQYDPMRHKIFDTTVYPEKLNETGQDDFKRTAFGLQKLAVNRISQSMFSNPVQRLYQYDKTIEQLTEVANIIEQIYKTHNNIDSENIERSKFLYAACQFVTIWSVAEKPTIIGDLQSSYKLIHRTYSEMDGFSIYPITDQYGDLLVVSIVYTDTNNKDHVLSYLNIEKPRVMLFDKEDDWVLNTELSKDLEIFPAVYMNVKLPIWGGDEGTILVEQLEEMESFDGMYIKRNSAPTFTLDYGDTTGGVISTTEEKSTDAKKIIVVGKNGGMNDVTWQGASDAIENRFSRLRNAFFEQIQMPDTSFANMLKSNTSAENKELIFADAKAKALDLAGEWIRLFYDEMIIVKSFIKVLFPSLATDIDKINVRSFVVPYSIRSKKENAEYIALAASAMSLETKVRILNETDDTQSEIDRIEAENAVTNNLL